MDDPPRGGPPTFSRRSRAGRPAATGWSWIGLAGLAVALLLGGWLRAVSPRTVEDLRPRPDALEYEEAARNLVAGDGYWLFVEGNRYPPRYPPGFSLLLAPWLAVADQGPGSGVVLVFGTALLTLVGTYLLAQSAAGPVAGAAAALLLAVSPLHVTYSRTVMSGIPSACAVTWLLLGVNAASRRRAPASWILLGFGIGLTSLLRLTNLVLALPAGIAALRGPTRAWRRTAALAAGLTLGVLPELAYNLDRFGSPFRTGYGLWEPAQFFALRYLFGRPAGGGSEPNLWVYGRALLGRGDLYPWPVAVLLGIGVLHGLRRSGLPRELALRVLAVALPLLGAYVVFFWQDPRFLLPVLPALLCVAAMPLGTRATPAMRIGAAGLVVLGLTILAREPELYAGHRRFAEWTVLEEIDAIVPPDAAVLVNTTEPLFRRSLRRPGTDRLWVRLGLDAHQSVIRLSRIPAEPPRSPRPRWILPVLHPKFAVARVAALLDTGRPVYLSTLLAHKVPVFPALIVRLQGHFRMELVARTAEGTELYRILRHSEPSS